MIKSFLVEPFLGENRDTSKDVEYLASKLVPVMDPFWIKSGAAHFGTPKWDLDLTSVAQLWLTRKLLFFVAEDNDRVVGALLGVHLHGLLQREALFVVELFYGETEEVETVLVDMLKSVFSFFPDDGILFPSFPGVSVTPSFLSTTLTRKNYLHKR
jgi:hypothetical protein